MASADLNQNMKRWISDQRFDSPDWTFVTVAVLLSAFLFIVLHNTWKRGVFDLTNWPLGNGQLTETFAMHPALTKSVDERMAIEQQRILYPTLVHVAAFGSPVFVPALLVFINYLGLCVMAWLSGLYTQSLTRHALWGVLIPLYPGFLTSLRSYSPEVLEICFLLGVLLCLRRSRDILATVFLSAAVLTKETALLMVIALALVCIFETRHSKKTIKWFHFTVPLIVFAIWEGILFKVSGSVPLINSRYEIGVPLAGFLRLFRSAVVATDTSLLTILLLIALMGLLTFSVLQMQDATLHPHEKVALCLYGCWVVCLSSVNFNADLNFLRASVEFYLIAITTVLVGIFHTRITIGTVVVFLWFLYAVSLARPFF